MKNVIVLYTIVYIYINLLKIHYFDIIDKPLITLTARNSNASEVYYANIFLHAIHVNCTELLAVHRKMILMYDDFHQI